MSKDEVQVVEADNNIDSCIESNDLTLSEDHYRESVTRRKYSKKREAESNNYDLQHVNKKSKTKSINTALSKRQQDNKTVIYKPSEKDNNINEKVTYNTRSKRKESDDMNLEHSNKKARSTEKGLQRKHSGEHTSLQQDNTEIKEILQKYLNNYQERNLTYEEVTKVCEYAKSLTAEEFLAIKCAKHKATFLHWAYWYLNKEFISELKLLKKSDSYEHNNILCAKGFTPLAWAVWGIPYSEEVGDITTDVEKLIDISEELSDKDMLANYSAFFGRVDILKILNKKGLLNLNDENNDQKTVLHFAAYKDDAKKSCNTAKVFKYLSDLIPETNLKVKKMLQVFNTAVKTKHSAIVVFILKELERRGLEDFNKTKELLKDNMINVIAANAKEEKDEESIEYLESLQQQNISNTTCASNASSMVEPESPDIKNGYPFIEYQDKNDNGLLDLGTENNGLLDLGTENHELLGLGTENNELLDLGTENHELLGLGTENNELLGLGIENNELLGLGTENHELLGLGIENHRLLNFDVYYY